MGAGNQNIPMRPQFYDVSVFYLLSWALEKRNPLCAHSDCKEGVRTPKEGLFLLITKQSVFRHLSRTMPQGGAKHP